MGERRGGAEVYRRAVIVGWPKFGLNKSAVDEHNIAVEKL